MAQGRKISAKTWKEFLRVYTHNATSVSKSCEKIGISPHSFYEKCANDHVFAEKARMIRRGVRVPYAEDRLFSLINEGDFNAIKYFLSNQGGRDWNSPKILPIIVQHEVSTSTNKVDAQRPPTIAERAAAKAFREVLFAVERRGDNPPKSLVVDLKSLADGFETNMERRLREKRITDKGKAS